MTEDDITPRLGYLTIADLDFVIDTATIGESTGPDGEQRWDLWISTIKRQLDCPPNGSFRWAPNIRGESVRVQAQPFASIIGQTIQVPNAYDNEHDEYLFSMYIFFMRTFSTAGYTFLSASMIASESSGAASAILASTPLTETEFLLHSLPISKSETPNKAAHRTG